MKKINDLQSYLTRLRGLILTLIILCSIGSGNVWGQESTHTSNVTLTAGTNGSACIVSISGNNYDGIKMGTSKNTGSMSFSVPAGVTTVYIHAAKWKGESGNLTIARSNGTVSPTSVTLIADAGVTSDSPFTLSDPSKATTDYCFKLTLESINTETTITLTTSTKRAVVWGVNTVVGASTYTVTYNGNDNTSGSVPTDATAYNSGATVTVKGNTGSLARTGYTFGGWNTKEDGSGTNYAAGTGTFTITANTTLYAKWTPIVYTVTWKVNGTNYSEGTPSTSVNHGSHVSTLPTAPDPASYCGDVFVGWTDNEYSGNSAPTPLYKTASEFPNATGNQTFYAVFADYAN